MPLGDVSQTNRAPDWLAPNMAGMPPAQAHTPGIFAWWDTSRQGITSEISVSLCTAHATQVSPSTTHRAGFWSYWDPSKQSPAALSHTHPVFLTTPTPFIGASYLLLVDHYLTTGYTPAGTTVTEGQQIPIGWIPTLAVDPLNSRAIQAFWNNGPVQIVNAEASRDFYPVIGSIFRRPQVYWQYVSPNTYILTGAGAILGVRSSG